MCWSCCLRCCIHEDSSPEQLKPRRASNQAATSRDRARRQTTSRRGVIKDVEVTERTLSSSEGLGNIPTSHVVVGRSGRTMSKPSTVQGGSSRRQTASRHQAIRKGSATVPSTRGRNVAKSRESANGENSLTRETPYNTHLYEDGSRRPQSTYKPFIEEAGSSHRGNSARNLASGEVPAAEEYTHGENTSQIDPAEGTTVPTHDEFGHPVTGEFSAAEMYVPGVIPTTIPHVHIQHNTAEASQGKTALLSTVPYVSRERPQTELYFSNSKPDEWLNPSMDESQISDVVYGYVTEYIGAMDLGDFYPAGSPVLHELCGKAAAIMAEEYEKAALKEFEDETAGYTGPEAEADTSNGSEDQTATLTGTDVETAGLNGSEDEIEELKMTYGPESVIHLAKIALYDIIIYCDDSLSMNIGPGGQQLLGGEPAPRVEALKKLVRRVTAIAAALGTGGIKVRFINFEEDSGFNDIHTVEEVERVLSECPFSGRRSAIGTGLERKILNEFLFAKIATRSLERPLLITTITDGAPSWEDRGYFKDMILRCQDILRRDGYSPKSVIFQVSQVGNEPDAEDFITALHDDPEIQHMVYCTSEKLDEKIEELRGNSRNLERWLLDLLLQGVRGPEAVTMTPSAQ